MQTAINVQTCKRPSTCNGHQHSNGHSLTNGAKYDSDLHGGSETQAIDVEKFMAL
jgi:hypothetical protein